MYVEVQGRKGKPTLRFAGIGLKQNCLTLWRWEQPKRTWEDGAAQRGRDRENAPNKSSSSSGGAGSGLSDRKRQGEAVHPEDVEREREEARRMKSKTLWKKLERKM